MSKLGIKRFPDHVAIFPDKNRTSAREKGLAPTEGYRMGGQVIETVAKDFFSLGTKYVSVWVLADWNLRDRDQEEIKELYGIIAGGVDEMSLSRWVHEDEVNIQVVGWRKPFGVKDSYDFDRERKTLDRAANRTSHYRRRFLNFFVEYSGEREREEVEKKKKIVREKHPDMEITERVERDLLSCLPYAPNVDLFIRTGCRDVLEAWEKGQSFENKITKDFLRYHVRESTTYFVTHIPWPDFGEREFQESLAQYLTDQILKVQKKINTV